MIDFRFLILRHYTFLVYDYKMYWNETCNERILYWKIAVMVIELYWMVTETYLPFSWQFGLWNIPFFLNTLFKTVFKLCNIFSTNIIFLQIDFLDTLGFRYRISRNFSEDLILALFARLFFFCIANNTSRLDIM